MSRARSRLASSHRVASRRAPIDFAQLHHASPALAHASPAVAHASPAVAHASPALATCVVCPHPRRGVRWLPAVFHAASAASVGTAAAARRPVLDAVLWVLTLGTLSTHRRCSVAGAGSHQKCSMMTGALPLPRHACASCGTSGCHSASKSRHDHSGHCSRLGQVRPPRRYRVRRLHDHRDGHSRGSMVESPPLAIANALACARADTHRRLPARPPPCTAAPMHGRPHAHRKRKPRDAPRFRGPRRRMAERWCADWASPSRTAATSASGLGSLLPHLRQDQVEVAISVRCVIPHRQRRLHFRTSRQRSGEDSARQSRASTLVCEYPVSI
jgi:hypothetical protein